MADNDEDTGLWDFATQDVKPLSSRDKKAEDTAPEPQKSAAKSSSRKIQYTAPKIETDSRIQSTEIDARTDDKLRRGRFPIDGKLDLHGQTQSQAFQSVQNFIINAYHSEKRCVLIVTGKGGYSKSDPDSFIDPQIQTGVLKSSFADWMRDPALRSFVLKFYPAQPKHGGGGAFYVLVRRKR